MTSTSPLTEAPPDKKEIGGKMRGRERRGDESEREEGTEIVA